MSNTYRKGEGIQWASIYYTSKCNNCYHFSVFALLPGTHAHTHADIFAESLKNRFRRYMYCFWPLKLKNKGIILHHHNIIITSKSQQWCHSINYSWRFPSPQAFCTAWKVKFNLPPLVGWMKWLTSVTGICQKWWSNLTLEIGLWKHRGFCLRYTLLNSLESLLLREARCYMGGHSGRQLHGPGAQELRPITYHMSETGCESSFSWILRW